MVTKTASYYVLIGTASFFLMAMMPQHAISSGSIAAGREIVRQHCTRCHVVPNMNPYGGIGSTPSFAAMKWLDDWEQRFEAFYTLPPHPVLVKITGLTEERSENLPAFVSEIELQVDDIDAILAFVRSLKTPD